MISVETESIKVNFVWVFGQVPPRCGQPVPSPSIAKSSSSGKPPSKLSAEALVDTSPNPVPTLYKGG